ncbi:hypothetical protein GH5_03093 [Leishmania sp. Ghana 2012 LV757]|uniref:hypothetical protein n=1 Tax=Leishmania sp. Ghana 2012 LV757 TaxID=2803181 RepID=UPI001B774F66|nr:hypothetical protein GH5_03093 [Leishmania sp. Ghana 2012 LV757]
MFSVLTTSSPSSNPDIELHIIPSLQKALVETPFGSRAHAMTTNTSQDTAAAPSPSPRTSLLKKVVIGTSVVLLVGVAWRAVYLSNQNEMKLRRAVRKSQNIRAALRDVPARRFSTTDVGPSPIQRKDLVERCG